MEIGNNIAVKFKKFNSKVKYDVIDGSIVLYNHSGMVDMHVPDMIFTGIKFDLHEAVVIKCQDLEFKEIKFSIWDSWLYIIVDNSNIGDPICIISFIPKGDHVIIKEFNAHFLEII